MKLGLPWIYGGCVGAEGQTMTILPGETACLRCLMPECPAPGSTPTCETAGILGPIVGVIASIEAAEAMKILSGNRESISRSLTVVDLWHNQRAADRRAPASRVRRIAPPASTASSLGCPAARAAARPCSAAATPCS